MKNSIPEVDLGYADFECDKCGTITTEKIRLGGNVKIDCPICGNKNIKQIR